MKSLQHLSSEYRTSTDALLDVWIFEQNIAERLREAMRYSVLNGGKRIRPVLVRAAAEAISTSVPLTHASAASVECIHAYSLVHDDLPAMDDDDLRRGKPTCHIQYDYATAILAGDALQTLAFEKLTDHTDTPSIVLSLIKELAFASGARGMVAGQMLDLLAENQKEAITLTALENIHSHKTGALIKAAVRMGAISVGANDTQLKCLTEYAEAIGLAFQLQDDIIDITSDTETLGKAQGADIARNKSTYVSLLGLDVAKEKALNLVEQAKESLTSFDHRADTLRMIADYIIQRNS